MISFKPFGTPIGIPGEEMPSPNLTPGGEPTWWSEEEFIQTIRSGVKPSGHSLNTDMPWMYFGRMSDDELKAVAVLTVAAGAAAGRLMGLIALLSRYRFSQK